MASKKAATSEPDARPKRRARRKKKSYTDRTYGARLPPEEARIVDDYAARNKLDCAGVVRLAVKHFVRRQQMQYQPKDPVRVAVEETLQEQLAPLAARLEAMSERGIAGAEITALLSEQAKVLERALVASTLALRLVTIYTVDPNLRAIDAREDAKVEPHLRAADGGRDAWCALTREVVKRAGRRVVRELNLLPSDAAPPDKSGCKSGDSAEEMPTIRDDELASVLS